MDRKQSPVLMFGRVKWYQKITFFPKQPSNTKIYELVTIIYIGKQAYILL